MNRRIEQVDPRLQIRYLIFLPQDLSLPLFGRTLFRQALFYRTMISARVAGRGARPRLRLARFLVPLRIFREVLIRDHLWPRPGCILGALFLPVLTRNVAKRLPVGGHAHQPCDFQNLQEHSLHNPLPLAPQNCLLMVTPFPAICSNPCNSCAKRKCHAIMANRPAPEPSQPVIPLSVNDACPASNRRLARQPNQGAKSPSQLARRESTR